MENDPQLDAFLAAYNQCKNTPEGDADEYERRCQNLRSVFEDLVENIPM